MYGDCPYCYRPIGTWKHDPIILPQGAKYDWVSDTELIYVADEEDRWYKGIQQIREDEIIELQQTLTDLEEDSLPEISHTIFSPINTSGKFQITGKHIKEMRDSVEKLLIALGLTKTDYFNYDEEQNHIIHPNGDKVEWTDPITDSIDLQKFQVKYIHIEDLRHFLQYAQMERFTKSTVGNIISPFTGDIGLAAWIATYYNYSNQDTYSHNGEPLQDIPTGQWYFPGYFQNISSNKSVISTGEIFEVGVGGNKYAKANSSGSGYVQLKQWYPAPNGWYPYGNYNWVGSIYSKTPLLDIIFFGTFINRRPIVTATKIFTYDLDCIGTKSHSTIQYCPYGGSSYITQYEEKLPHVTVEVILSDKQIGAPGVEHTKTLTNTYSDIQLPGISGTFTIDVWNLWVQANPTYKYVKSMKVTLSVDEIYRSYGGNWGSLPLVGSNVTGSLTLNLLDNIGLTNL
jgi:hypothetical protein